MHRIPPSKPYGLLTIVLTLCLMAVLHAGNAFAQGTPPQNELPLPPEPNLQPAPPPPLAQAAAPPTKPAEPSLVDKLLEILSNKNVPRIDIPAPDNKPEPAAEPTMKAAPPPPPVNSGIEISQNFIPIYSFDRDDADEESPPVLPFFSTSPINEVHKGIQTIVVMLPDQTREAARAYAYARSAQEEASARHPEWNADSSFLFVPQGWQ
jgi:hypothetical protein